QRECPDTDRVPLPLAPESRGQDKQPGQRNSLESKLKHVPVERQRLHTVMFELIAMSIPAGKQYRYLDLLINIYVVVLIVSNLIAPKPVAFYVPLLSKWIGPM